MGTESLIIYIKTDDIYKDIKEKSSWELFRSN